MSGSAEPAPISREELELELGRNIAAAYIKAIRVTSGVLIPNFNQFQVGDVVLSRSASRLPKIIRQYIPSIGSHQEGIKRLNVDDAATWSHAMLYVGQLHIAESQKTSGKRSGINISALTKPVGTDLVICRRLAVDVDEDVLDFYKRRSAHYALLDHAINNRTYDASRIISISTDGRGPIGNIVTKFIRPNFTKSIICSEFVLECLAIGGKMLTNEWESIKIPQRYFYPADFYVADGFERIPVSYRRLSD